MKAMQTQPGSWPKYVHHGEIGVLVDGEDISIEEWIEEMEADPSLMVGLAWTALLGTLLGIAWGMLFYYILHWGLK